MNRRLPLIFIILISGSIQAGQKIREYQFLSPLPGSIMISPQTDLIIRQGGDIDPATLVRGHPIRVTGSASGLHSGDLHLSDDGKTIVFLPDEPFSPQEKVTVSIGKGIETTRGDRIPSAEFSFSTGFAPQGHPAWPSVPDQLEPEALRENGPGHYVRSQAPTFASVHDSLVPTFPAINIPVSLSPPAGCLFLTSSSFDTSYKSNYLMIIDNAGRPRFARLTPSPCTDFKIQPNRLLTYYDGARRKFYAMDSSFAVVDSFKAGNGYPTDLHDLRLLPNGHTLILAYFDRPYRMDLLVHGGNDSALVRENIVQELDSRKQVIFEWRSWEHFEVLDATHEDLTAAFIDYVHANAIELDADGNILLSSRHLDEVTKINRQTGDIIWRLGGKNNEFTFVNDPIGFSHQHAVRRLGNGHMTLFDNGNYHTPSFSRAVEYALDEVQKQITLLWQYRNTPDTYGFAMGYVQRLDDGNTLVGWGATNPTVTIVSPQGEKLYELTFPIGVVSYRAYLFPWPATSLTSVQDPQNNPVALTLEQNFPNPFNPSTEIRYGLPHDSFVTVTVFNLLGQQVAQLVHEQQRAGGHSIAFNAEKLPSGAYFYRLRAVDTSTGSPQSFVTTKKLVIVK